MKKVDVKNLKVLSERTNSITYISNDNKWIIKFLKAGIKDTKEEFENQIKKTKIIKSLGIPTPEVGEIIEDEDGTLALEYEYIEDKISFSRAVSKNPERMGLYMIRFSNVARLVHSTKINDSIKKELPNIEDLILKIVYQRKDIFKEERIKKIKNLMSSIEKTDTLMHLDFQPGNYIMSKKGDLMIDLQTICYGNPLYDLGLFYFLYHNISEESITALSRCNIDQAKNMWRKFIKYYFDYTTEKEIDDFEIFISPISFLSALAAQNFIPKETMMQYMKENFDKVFT